jgi:hypothetical protein
MVLGLLILEVLRIYYIQPFIQVKKVSHTGL